MKCWNPECGNHDLSERAITCPECGTDRPRTGRPRARVETEEDRRIREQIAQLRERLAQGGPSSWDLTEQQWYNVCRFFPHVAARSARPMLKVGPDHPLHATSRMGSLLAGWRAPPAVREPGEDPPEAA